MDDSLKVTGTNDERNFTEIFSGESVVNIPLFQREYKWGAKNLEAFWNDVDAILDGSKNSQFLGVVVTVPQPQAMGAPRIFDVVDGQQRLFTCHLAVAAAVRVALDNDRVSWAIDVAKSLLVMRRTTSSPTNTKIIPSAKDRQQFNALWTEIANHPKVKQAGGWGEESFPTPPGPSGPEIGELSKQYKRILMRFKTIYQNDGFEKFVDVVTVIATKLSLVTISLRDPIAAPIIFERLNSRGEKITTADLVRNEIFSRDANNPTKATSVFANNWEPFQRKFDDLDLSVEVLLFPYGLTLDPNTTKAELFQKLRKRWSGLPDTTDVIAELDRNTDSLFVLEKGILSQSLPESLKSSLRKLHLANSPTSIYPFVFMAVQSVKEGKQSGTNIVNAFETIESFLVKRAVCGIEPTGLHAVFKGMWQDIVNDTDYSGIVSGNEVSSQIRKRSTVAWPSRDQFAASLKNDPIYRRKICKFVVSQYEISTKGETPQDDFWLEHILPNKYHAENWGLSFSAEEHNNMKDTLANLLPLTSDMNIQESQNKYEDKRLAFRDSIFAATRDFAETYSNWNMETWKARSEILAEWALNRWTQ